ncbi:MAG TPA: glycosyltransferase, partial [Yinghuangia sp.]|nr:glycosyltransferase [Yinghuangia sp.]
MPNKLFHAVRAGVPVVATDVRELARVVREHDLGTLYRPGDAGSLAAAIGEARERYPQLLANVRAAEPLLSWEHDAKILLGVYDALRTGA